jgi:hypothetical protein
MKAVRGGAGRWCPAAVCVTHGACRAGIGGGWQLPPGSPRALYSSRQCASSASLLSRGEIPDQDHTNVMPYRLVQEHYRFTPSAYICVLLFYPEEGGNRLLQNNGRP